MNRVALSDWVQVAGVAAAVIMSSEIAFPTVHSDGAQRFAEAVVGPARILGGAADLEVRYIQEDGPSSGHVRAVLTPETRSLTILEARSAAQQAFLEALKAPGLGDNLSRITVVVRLNPASHPDPQAASETFLFLHKGDRTWSITAED